MILVTPYAAGLTDYDGLAQSLNRRGRLSEHVHLVVCRPQDEDAAVSFADEVVDLFAKSFHRVIPPQDAVPAVRAYNAMFRAACRFLLDYRPVAGEIAAPPMLYSSPRWRPAKIGWLNAIQADYYARQAPKALGRIREPRQGAEPQVWGPVVLSAGYVRDSALMDFLPPRVPWRRYLRDEIALGMKPATTIGPAKDASLRPYTPPFSKKPKPATR